MQFCKAKMVAQRDTLFGPSSYIEVSTSIQVRGAQPTHLQPVLSQNDALVPVVCVHSYEVLRRHWRTTCLSQHPFEPVPRLIPPRRCQALQAPITTPVAFCRRFVG